MSDCQAFVRAEVAHPTPLTTISSAIQRLNFLIRTLFLFNQVFRQFTIRRISFDINKLYCYFQ
jgi:hypothetical protein